MSADKRARAEKVARLKARVAAGEYDVDPEALADKLVDCGVLEEEGAEEPPEEDRATDPAADDAEPQAAPHHDDEEAR